MEVFPAQTLAKTLERNLAEVGSRRIRFGRTLAYSIWPERVREKCKSDKSLAIAHDVEELYVEPSASTKKKKTKKPSVDEETEGWFNDD